MLPTNDSNEIKIELTSAAFEQIFLIKSMDYTVESKSLRLKIGGKGCNGFDYELGFTPKEDKDICVEYCNGQRSITLFIDPFTSHYCSDGEIDYLFDPNGEEGFTFNNKREHLYHGKFFKDESMLPPEGVTINE